ncbi:hypothetical protein C7B80_32300 [Cyanosarcina cf. burmensis CCALA 770]|nr:hypothetical protein C7B80_32300 [Cyanosarcina cf. burmensis CCALA 770]
MVQRRTTTLRYNRTSGKQWGGRREGAGNPKWKSGAATPVRIPLVLHEAVLAYAHALDERQQLDAALSEPQGMIQANPTDKPLTAEDIWQMRQTLEAVRLTLEQWRGELAKHNTESLRWKKAKELFDALETQLGAS